MYQYNGLTLDQMTGLSKSGDLVSLLILAKRMYNRQGMIGQIFRPDGTELREVSRKINFPKRMDFFVLNVWRDYQYEIKTHKSRALPL